MRKRRLSGLRPPGPNSSRPDKRLLRIGRGCWNVLINLLCSVTPEQPSFLLDDERRQAFVSALDGHEKSKPGLEELPGSEGVFD